MFGKKYIYLRIPIYLNNNFITGVLENGKSVTVKDLLKILYEKACSQKLWGLVRHSAGMLGKRVEDLAKAVTDLLVRQKQITVGMPPNNENTITAPLPENELRQLIHSVSTFYLNKFLSSTIQAKIIRKTYQYGTTIF